MRLLGTPSTYADRDKQHLLGSSQHREEPGDSTKCGEIFDWFKIY
jgi:hypothetical protein